MPAKFANYQDCPEPECPGLHSHDAPAPAPEAATAELWATRADPEPEAEL